MEKPKSFWCPVGRPLVSWSPCGEIGRFAGRSTVFCLEKNKEVEFGVFFAYILFLFVFWFLGVFGFW